MTLQKPERVAYGAFGTLALGPTRGPPVLKNTVSANDVLVWTRSALASGPAKSDQPTQRGHEEPSPQNRVTL